MNMHLVVTLVITGWVAVLLGGYLIGLLVSTSYALMMISKIMGHWRVWECVSERQHMLVILGKTLCVILAQVGAGAGLMWMLTAHQYLKPIYLLMG